LSFIQYHPSPTPSRPGRGIKTLSPDGRGKGEGEYGSNRIAVIYKR
jgi:hypothetical protein